MSPTAPPTAELSAAEARRIAVAAQGFAGSARTGSPSAARVDALLGRLGVVQIDSVNAVARSHYLPLLARLGPYERARLDDAAYRRRSVFEYWGHEASFLPIDLWPAMRWRMDRYRDRALGVADEPSSEGRMTRLARERPGYVESVLAEVRERGPLATADLSDPGTSAGPWWGWSDGKLALEHLFAIGEVTVAHRRGFTRYYDVPERVIPAAIRTAPALDADSGQRLLVERSAAALGIATVPDLADYYRLRTDLTKARVAELVADGRLTAVRVEGWEGVAYLHPEARVPRRIGGTALLSPFDSLVWDRARTERIFGFRYRLEIYTPAAKRVYGYYVLPLLSHGRLVGRLDVRANRAAGALEVPGAFAEPGCATPAVAEAAAGEIRRLADWLGLDRVSLGTRGDLVALMARTSLR